MADANYTRIKVERITTRARRLLDQIPLTSESTDTESHITGSASTFVSDAELVDLVNDAERAIIRSVKASHIYDMIQKDTALTPTKQVVRLLRNRVFSNAVRARRQRVDTRRRLNDPGRVPSATHPIYTYEAGVMSILPNTTPSWHYVTTPTPFDSSDPATALTQSLHVDERFERAMVYYVAALSYQKMQRSDLFQMTYVVFLDEMAAYSTDTVTGIVKDREVEVE